MSKRREKDKKRAEDNKRARLVGKLANLIERACNESRNGIAKARLDILVVHADLAGQLTPSGSAVLRYWNDFPTWELRKFVSADWRPDIPKSALEKLAEAIYD